MRKVSPIRLWPVRWGKSQASGTPVQSGKVSVQSDFGLETEVTSSELDVDKTGYRFVTGASMQLDDPKIWWAK
jgi:hypothetical protein